MIEILMTKRLDTSGDAFIETDSSETNKETELRRSISGCKKKNWWTSCAEKIVSHGSKRYIIYSSMWHGQDLPKKTIRFWMPIESSRNVDSFIML